MAFEKVSESKNFEDTELENDLVLTEDESDEIINNLKDELIMESILEQIENPLNNFFGNALGCLSCFPFPYWPESF